MIYLIRCKNINFIGNEKAVFKFVNKNTSDAYNFIDNMEVAKQWLNENGYKITPLKNLNKGIYFFKRRK